MFKVLLVEDSEECQLLVKKALSKSDVEILPALKLQTAMDLVKNAANDTIHLILLDLMLPDGDGIQLLNVLQTHEHLHEVPIFLLTSKEELTSKVTAFSLGAEDYLVKPVDPIELKARVEMRLRKTQQKKKSLEVLKKGDLSLNLSLMKATVIKGEQEEVLDLTSKEFKILSFLAQNEGQVYSRSQLVKKIWGDSVHVLDRTVDSHVCGLRRKLSEHAEYIESIPGAGYRFNFKK